MISTTITPERKKRVVPLTPPSAPQKRRQIDDVVSTPTGDPLLLISTDANGKIVTFCSNHPLLSEISGHYGVDDIDAFYSEELFESVLGVVGGNGFSAVYRELFSTDDIAERKKASLLKLFSQDIYGGETAGAGQVFRGTIVIG